ncbi:UDP-N-acetylmuramoylalanyl-D-glutamate--2,6-diaminopimelate ligase [Streptomyces lancefieldiae]|uniref:UDP-N-acetylmuramoylalanyl-D-glutamate--2, 6-diaminopimelate ligase n=1 Tax=Streptomyces lancefieldiae TaxID=3075520 RepID=UPI00288AC4DB|nr:UDP-N-acetylmuramoylalanyl-D-glutamate--2,6-diaminopimelate ligase [Streptomyces sp. DSM 40712]
MLELGDEAVESHREVGRYAAEIGVDFVLAKQLTLAASAAGVTEISMVRDNETVAAYLGSILRPGDVVLLKASRGGTLADRTGTHGTTHTTRESPSPAC